MKKVLAIVVVVGLVFFGCIRKVVAESMTFLNAQIAITRQDIEFDPSELVEIADWSYLMASDGQITPGSVFFQKGAYPAYSDVLPYRSEVGSVVVNQGDFLKLTLYCEGILPEDVLCTFCIVSGGGLEKSVPLINQQYLKKFQIGSLNYETFQNIAEQVEDLSEEEIIALNSPSVFYVDTKMFKNTEDIVLQFGIMHRGDRKRITIFIFSFTRKDEGQKVTHYTIGLQSPMSGLPAQGLRATGEHYKSGFNTGNIYAKDLQEMQEIKQANDEYYSRILNGNNSSQPIETNRPANSQDVNYDDLKDGQVFTLTTTSSLKIHMEKYTGFKMVPCGSSSGAQVIEYSFQPDQLHILEIPYDAMGNKDMVEVSIETPEGGKKYIVIKK